MWARQGMGRSRRGRVWKVQVGLTREEGLSLESVKRNVEVYGVEEGLCSEELLRAGVLESPAYILQQAP